MGQIIKKIKVIALALSCIIASGTSLFIMDKPVTAEAWHWDFWNYEENCLVIYEQINTYGNYKVLVMSEDNHRIWRNDVEYVPYWYPYGYMRDMIGRDPGLSGAVRVDVYKDLLSNPSYFARFSA